MKTTIPRPSPTSTFRVERFPALGRNLGAILSRPAPQLRFLAVTVRRSNLPPPRQLFLHEIRECGPRSGITFRLGHPADRPWRTDGELSPRSVAQLLTRLAK